MTERRSDYEWRLDGARTRLEQTLAAPMLREALRALWSGDRWPR
jgi:hypothetical protein